MSEQPTDAELLRRFVADRANDAFAELVRRYLGLVFHAALRQLGGDRHAAEDVAQVVFALLARKAGALIRHESLAGWLHTTTRYASRSFARAAHRRQQREQEAAHMHENAGGATDWERLRPLIDEALAQLTERDREAVLLRFFVGLPFAEIGKRFGLGENAARMRVDRALDHLQQTLARRGVCSTCAALALTLGGEAAAGEVPAALLGSITANAVAATAIQATAGVTLGFMKAKTTAALISAALLTSSFGIATYEWSQYRHAVNDRETMEVSVAAIQSERARLVREGATTNARELVPAADNKVTPPGYPTGRLTTPSAAVWDNVAEGNAFLVRHPEVKTALTDYAKARTRYRFGSLYSKLNLTPGQIERFEAVASEGTGMGAPAPENEISSRRQLNLVTGDRPVAERERELESILGAEGMNELRQLRASLGSREIVNSVAGALWFTDTPLTPAQSDQLVSILFAAKTKSGRDWDTALISARTVLLPEQVAVLEGMRAQVKFNAILNRPAKRTAPGKGGAQ